MDGEEAVLVCCCSNDVCRQEERPAEEAGVAEEVRAENLKTDDAGADVLCKWLWAAELGDLFKTSLAGRPIDMQREWILPQDAP